MRDRPHATSKLGQSPRKPRNVSKGRALRLPLKERLQRAVKTEHHHWRNTVTLLTSPQHRLFRTRPSSGSPGSDFAFLMKLGQLLGALTQPKVSGRTAEMDTRRCHTSEAPDSADHLWAGVLEGKALMGTTPGDRMHMNRRSPRHASSLVCSPSSTCS